MHRRWAPNPEYGYLAMGSSEKISSARWREKNLPGRGEPENEVCRETTGSRFNVTGM